MKLSPEQARRREILQTIAELEMFWLKHPHLRLGQLVSDMAGLVNLGRIDDGDPLLTTAYYLEDYDLRRTLSEHS